MAVSQIVLIHTTTRVLVHECHWDWSQTWSVTQRPEPLKCNAPPIAQAPAVRNIKRNSLTRTTSREFRSRSSFASMAKPDRLSPQAEIMQISRAKQLRSKECNWKLYNNISMSFKLTKDIRKTSKATSSESIVWLTNIAALTRSCPTSSVQVQLNL